MADLSNVRKTGGLLGEIQSHLIKQADAPSERRQDIIHPSEMANHDWCPRATYYRIRDVRDGKKLTPEQHAVGTLAIFEEGHSIHRKYQGWLREMVLLEGRWDCLACNTRGIAWGLDPKVCKCGSATGIVYGEVPLDAEKEVLICGHADGKVLNGLIEIKSIGKGTLRMDAPDLLKRHTHKTVEGKNLLDMDGLWSALSRPLPAHVKQANIYLWIARLMGIDVDHMIFLYEFKANQQTKSFTIKLSERVMAPLLEKVESINNALMGPAVYDSPDRAFSKPDKKPCSSCAWKTECWEGADAEDSPKPEPDNGSRRKTAGGEGRKAAGKPVSARAARRHSVQDSEGPYVPRRFRSDGSLRRDDSVGELSRDVAEQGTGRRKVRRVRPGNSPGVSSPR